MSLPSQIPVLSIRRWEADQTSMFLGDTISLSEEQWREPSLLPGWSRAHIAAHLSMSADSLGWIALNTRASFDKLCATNRAMLERNADRPGLNLQIDLDTSAEALVRTWDAVNDWNRQIRLLNASYPLAVLPLIRLHEICIHRLDLKLNPTLDQIDSEAATWLLRWVLHRLEDTHSNELTIVSESGLRASLGNRNPRRVVSGTDAQLWAWLSGRTGSEGLSGAEGLGFDLLH
ncbi:MAG: maleylpyruvate isomerase family mycothiol-dependent enzyme [Propionibacteriaceae bacterium]|nr:maleylpyruvate isomerase family mycothiol-dependent enzyme [Propionibacteriaceae bacterium]